MKLTINRSLINQVYGEIKSIAAILASVIGSAKPQGPKLEVPELPDNLTTGLDIQTKMMSIKVSEDTIDIEIMDEFILDYVKLYSSAIPLFAPVVASAVISAKMMAANVQVFTEKWSDKTGAYGTVADTQNPVASDHKVVKVHGIGVFNDYSSSVALKLIEVADTEVMCIQAIKSYGVKNIFLNRAEFHNFVSGSADMFTDSQGTTIIRERSRHYTIRAVDGSNVEETALRPKHVSTILATLGVSSEELIMRLYAEDLEVK